jgi:hypothetical protein
MTETSVKLIRVKVGERVYTATPFNPIDGFEFGLELLGAISPAISGVLALANDANNKTQLANNLELIGAEFSKALMNSTLKPLLRKAFDQCFTPENKALSNDYEFNMWFQRFPGDMFELVGRVTWELVKDFLPVSLASTATTLINKL